MQRLVLCAILAICTKSWTTMMYDEVPLYHKVSCNQATLHFRHCAYSLALQTVFENKSCLPLRLLG